jgi:hypothetical protein
MNKVDYNKTLVEHQNKKKNIFNELCFLNLNKKFVFQNLFLPL